MIYIFKTSKYKTSFYVFFYLLLIISCYLYRPDSANGYLQGDFNEQHVLYLPLASIKPIVNLNLNDGGCGKYRLIGCKGEIVNNSDYPIEHIKLNGKGTITCFDGNNYLPKPFDVTKSFFGAEFDPDKVYVLMPNQSSNQFISVDCGLGSNIISYTMTIVSWKWVENPQIYRTPTIVMTQIIDTTSSFFTVRLTLRNDEKTKMNIHGFVELYPNQNFFYYPNLEPGQTITITRSLFQDVGVPPSGWTPPWNYVLYGELVP